MALRVAADGISCRNEDRARKNPGAIFFRTVRSVQRSGLALLPCCGFFALRFQLSVLLRRENSLRLLEECSPAFPGAACFHALGLPVIDFCLLILREIQCCQIEARHRTGVGRALGTACLVSRKRAGCSQHRSRNQSCYSNFDHGE